MKLSIYAPEQLAPIITEGASGYASQSQWVGHMLSSFAEIVKRRPVAYRAFGPFWWPIKAMMVKSGVLAAESPDPDLVAQATMGAALDVAAAWAFQEQAHESMTAMNNTFAVDTEDGDTVDYLLMDDEMEALALTA